jgi:glycosyltransferase involved in cell wall biosynthesis
LDTIFNQTFQDFEVILLDDCSTDGGWEYLKQFSDHPKVSHCIRNESNSGSPFKQWKKGLELTKYDWIWIAESDDFSDLHFLEKCVSRIEENVSLVFVKSEFVDQKGAPLYFNGVKHEMKSYDLGNMEFRMGGRNFLEDHLIYRNYILNASAVVFKKPSSFPNSILTMRYAGDWFFWISNSCLGDVVYIPSMINFYRYHEATTRSNYDEQSEMRRFKEDMICIKAAKEILGNRYSIFKNLEKFTERIYYHFRLRFKYGRLRWFSLFPKMPFVFYPLYYKFFLESLVCKR